MTEEKKWYQKIPSFTVDRIVFLLFLIFITIPYVIPLGLPMIVTEKTLKFYNTLESIKPGGRMLWLCEIAPALYAVTGPGEIAFFKHMFTLCREKNIKFIYLAGTPDGAEIEYGIVRDFVEPYGFMEGLEYGVDYVNLGWVPGGEVAYHGLVADFQGTVEADYYGTPISELPIVKDIKGGEDFDVLGWSTSTGTEAFMRQWVPVGKPIICNTHGLMTPMIDPYYEKGMLTSYLYDIRGGAEYEYLTGYKGVALESLDAQSMVQLLGVTISLISAIYFISKRLRK